jgi:HSP20 family molecular chaperone IbpA
VLPGSVSPDALDAVYTEGILSVTVPKKDEAKEKLVEVKVK